MVSSLNQVRHLYALGYYSGGTFEASMEKAGIEVKTVGTNTGAIQKQIYFLVKGYDTVLKSDYIPVQNITYAKATGAGLLVTPMKKVSVALSANVNSGAPVVGQDYILRINLRQFYGMSDQDQYFKDAVVHVTKGMDATAFYEAMVKALNLCFAREVGATADSNPYLKFSVGGTGNYIEIEEKEQPWTLGTEAQERVYFEVVPTTIYADGDDVIWGEVQELESTTFVNNGKKIADLEYFLLGERGDQYRKIGWPNDIETKGMVDPTKAYNVLDIHYTFSDTGVNSYNTEKDITIVAPQYQTINKIVEAINTATGLSIAAINEEDAVPTADTSEEKAVVDDDAVATDDTSEEKAVAEDDAVATDDTSEEKAVDDAEGQSAEGDEEVGISDTTEEKPVVDSSDEESTPDTTVDGEGTETVTA